MSLLFKKCIENRAKTAAGFYPGLSCGYSYVDETGIDCYLYREYGYGPRGQLVRDRIKGRKYKRTSIVAAQMESPEKIV